MLETAKQIGAQHQNSASTMAVRGAGFSKAMLSSTTPANRPPAASAASSML
jgi:hypothetical protein